MKLYTKEQVIEMIYDAHNGIVGYDDIFKKQTPIELPSDEEIYLRSETQSEHSLYNMGFKYGAKWVIEQIKQQVDGTNTK